MKLFAWQPDGHGQLSWFVCAKTLDDAKKAIDQEISRRLSLDNNDPDRIRNYDILGWGTDYYALTICAVGTPISNNND